MSLQIAEQYEENEQFDKAYEEYKKLYDANPKDMNLIERLGHLAMMLGNKSEAADYYSKILDIPAENESHVRHDSDYYLYDKEKDHHYLIELKIGGDLDNKKARSEKEAILEQYAILSNLVGDTSKITIYFATAYNRYGEDRPWRQERVKQFFGSDELLIGRDFWNFICKSNNGYKYVLESYRENAHYIKDALGRIKKAYLE